MKTSISFLHWMPRIICLLAILIISSLAFDSFVPNLTIWQQFGAFLIHLIPTFILIAFLVVAWKWEFIGGIIFIALGIGLSPFIYNHNYNMNHSVGMSIVCILIINFPFVVVGILFILNHFIKKKNLKTY